MGQVDEQAANAGRSADETLPRPESPRAANTESETPQVPRHGEPSAAAPTATDDRRGDAAAPAPSKGKDKEATTSPVAAPVLSVAVADKKEDDSLSIGPSTELPPPALVSSPSSGGSGKAAEGLTASQQDVHADHLPVCAITLLLPTGARHPYKIDERYLAKRNVEVPEEVADGSGKKDPFSISVYKLKELILREWRDEWEGKPASPSSIRLIHFGKLLDDKEQLKKYQFSADSPNVVHMSVRPAEMLEEDEAAKAKGSTREGRSREGGGGCCVIL